MEQMSAGAGVALAETVFYSRRGNRVTVPSEWFTPGTQALGLSRSEMDLQLLERAKSAGVEVLEEAHASRPVYEDDAVRGIRLKAGEAARDFQAMVTIDATGRTRALARHL